MLGSILQAQLSIVPQVGLEGSKTSVDYNESSTFSPLGTKFSPQASVRLDYKFKKGHGPFVGLSTARPGVNYVFSNPEAGNTLYAASRDNTQLRLEGGYQYTTKKLFFNKSGSKNSSDNISSTQSSGKRNCLSSYMMSRCGNKSYSRAVASAPANKGAWVALQPSAGVAFVPTASAAEISTLTDAGMTSYEYTAGNYKTAAIAGLGFLFGKNDQQKLLVTINYVQGIGNMGTETLASTFDSKPIVTRISSNSSNWNLRVGVPFNFTKTKKTVAPKEVIIIKQRTEIRQPAEVQKPKEERKCGSYYRCRKAA